MQRRKPGVTGDLEQMPGIRVKQGEWPKPAGQGKLQNRPAPGFGTCLRPESPNHLACPQCIHLLPGEDFLVAMQSAA